MEPKVDQSIMDERLDKIMSLQNNISLQLNKEYIGKTYKAIVDSYNYNKNAYIVRNFYYAPDDVDGCIYINTSYNENIKPGYIIDVEIIDANSYDLIGKIKVQN